MTTSLSEKLMYFGAGCGVGVLLGALFAPQSGQETRENLSNKVEEFGRQVQQKSSGLRERASQSLSSAVEKGKNVASIGRQRVNESVESARQKYNESINESIEDEKRMER